MKKIFKQEPRDYGNATVNAEYVLSEFEKLSKKKKVNILENALLLVLDRKAGTREYAIARCMGYKYEDNGTYLKPGYSHPIYGNK